MRVLRHLLAWLRRDRLDDDMRDELAQHVEWRTEELVNEGVPLDEARRQASVAVGNLTRLREESRDTWGFPALDSIAQDVNYGVRQIVRTPSVSSIAILSIGIGIGATTAVFSLAHAVLLQSMAVKDPDSLFVLKWRSGPVFPFSSLNGNGQQTASGLASTSFSFAAYQSFRTEAASRLDTLGFADLDRVNVGAGGRAELASAHAVSGNYFTLLGVAPVAGRALGPDDDRIDAPGAAVISYRLWRNRFGGSSDAVGTTITVNAVPCTIVGVAPAAFHGTGQVGTDPDLYVPLMLHARVMPSDDPMMEPNFWWVLAMGRLRPGVGREDARATLDVLLKRTVAAAKPSLTANDLPTIDLLPGGRGQVEVRADMYEPLRTMGFVTLVVLFIACANVAGLLLARGRARMRELSVRVALGARRARIVRQLLTEALLLAGAGAALGLIVARWISAALVPALGGGQEPLMILTALNPAVLGFAVAVAVAAAVSFGLVPALRATRLDVGAGLQEAGRDPLRAPRHKILSRALVVVQIAMALLLVAGAALLVRSLRNLERVDLGFRASNLLLFRIDPALNGYEDARVAELYTRVLDRLRATPGVAAASLASHRLISNSAAIGVALREDETAPDLASPDNAAFQRRHLAWNLTVDERFFSTLGIPLARGRVFAPADERGAPLAVINRALARQLFGTEDVLGRRFNFGSRRRSNKPAYEVIGIVDNARYSSVRDDSPPTMYVYYRQHPEMKNAPTFYVRTEGSAASLAPAMRDIVREIDPALPVFGVMTQTDQIAASMRQERLFATLATLLGAVAVLLAAIGVYGLLAYGVARRRTEIGLRMALGAERGSVQWMILRESLQLALVGLLAGVPLALAGTRMLESLLFGLAPRDPMTIAGAAACMLALAAAAGYLPARRASRVDPMVALRAE